MLRPPRGHRRRATPDRRADRDRATRATADPPGTTRAARFLPDASFSAQVTVTEAGEVDGRALADERGGAPPSDLAEKIRLIVRTVYRQAKSDGEPPALRASSAGEPTNDAAKGGTCVGPMARPPPRAAGNRSSRRRPRDVGRHAARLREGRAADGPQLHRRREARLRRGDGRVRRAQLDRVAGALPRSEAEVQLLEVRAPRRAPHRRRRLRAGEVRRGHPRLPPVRARPPLRRRRGLLRALAHRRGAVRADLRVVPPPDRGRARSGRHHRRLQGAQELRPRLPERQGVAEDPRAPRRRHGAPHAPRALRRALLSAPRQLRGRRPSRPVRHAHLRGRSEHARGAARRDASTPASRPRRSSSSARST